MFLFIIICVSKAAILRIASLIPSLFLLTIITHISDNKRFYLSRFYNNPCFSYFERKQTQFQPTFFHLNSAFPNIPANSPPGEVEIA